MTARMCYTTRAYTFGDPQTITVSRHYQHERATARREITPRQGITIHHPDMLRSEGGSHALRFRGTLWESSEDD